MKICISKQQENFYILTLGILPSLPPENIHVQQSITYKVLHLALKRATKFKNSHKSPEEIEQAL